MPEFSHRELMQMLKIDKKRIGWTRGEEVMILELESGKLSGLNEVGAFIWPLLETVPLDQIATKVSEEFEVTEGEALRDLQTFVLVMEGRGYLRRTP